MTRDGDEARLEEASRVAAPAARPRDRRRPLPWLALAAAVILAGVLALRILRPSTSESAPVAVRGAPPAAAERGASAPPPGASPERAADGTYGGTGLRQERRELTCRGERVVRVAHWTPGGWLARLTVRDGELPPREAWYDETGRLRATRPALAPPGGPPLPARAPTPAEIATSCEW